MKYQTKAVDGSQTTHKMIYDLLCKNKWNDPTVKFCTIRMNKRRRRGWWAWEQHYTKFEYLGKNYNDILDKFNKEDNLCQQLQKELQ